MREDKVKELKSIIEEKWLKKEFNPFEENEFPDKDVDLDPGKPGEYESINPAYQYQQNSNSNDFRIQSTPQDLKETIEIKFTPEIKELARQLDNDPVKIYEYVRNNFDYEPYYGSVKGAQQTLWQKSGNDFDQASLLMALYRESGIPTRYVYGTVRVPIEKVKNWVGIEDAQTALDALSSGGIPTTGLVQGGEIAYAKLEHMWVEAKVSLKDYAGITTKETGKTWVALDPSFKQYKKIEGVDLEEKVPFDAEGLMEELKAGADIGDDGDSVTDIDQEVIKKKLEERQKKLKNYLDNNHLDDRMIDIMGGYKLEKEKYSILPTSLSYQVVSVKEELDSLNNYYREQITLKLQDAVTGGNVDISHKSTISELLGKRISLNYVAATKKDAELIASYLPKESEEENKSNLENLSPELPAHLIKVKPQILVDGKVITTGAPVTMGTRQDFYLDFSHPTSNVGKDHYEVTAGANYVINLNNGRMTNRQLDDNLALLKELNSNLENNNFDQVALDTLNSKMLHAIGTAYYTQVDMYNQLLQKRKGIRSVRMTSAGLTSVNLKVGYLMGMPREAKVSGLSIDLKRESYNNNSIDGDKEKLKAYNVVSGILSSYMEGHIFAQIVAENVGDAKPISTMHILNYANRNGIKLYEIDKDNVDQVLSELDYDSSKKQMFRNHINNGKKITVPKKEVTIGNWAGTGYIIMKDDGTAAYMISGGMNGGFISDFGKNYAKGFADSMIINAWIQNISSYKNVIAAGESIFGPAFRLSGSQSRTLVKSLKGVSKICGVITAISYTHGVYSDFKKYEGANEWKAAAITTVETVATVGAGAFLAGTSLPAVVAIAGGTVIGMAIKGIGNWTRKKLLGFYNRLKIYAIVILKKRKGYLSLRGVA